MDNKLEYCAISSIRKDGSTSIKTFDGNHHRKVTLANVRSVKPMTDDSKAGLKANFEHYRQSRKDVFRQRREIKELLEAEDDRQDLNKKVIDSLNTYFDKPLLKTKDNIPQCFYKQSMRMVASKGEKEMPELVWYRHFEMNPGLMTERYEPLTNAQVLQDSCEKFRKRDSMKMARRGSLTIADSKFRDMQASLGIKSFGVYNCDQLMRIQSPVDIMAAYKDEENNEPNIASVFMIDHSINSVLVFNGYLDLWPDHFSYGRYSKNTLIAFDNKGESFICKPEEFNRAVSTPGSTKTFRLKKIEKDATKKEILATAK